MSPPTFTVKVSRRAEKTVNYKYLRPTTVSASCNVTGSSSISYQDAYNSTSIEADNLMNDVIDNTANLQRIAVDTSTQNVGTIYSTSSLLTEYITDHGNNKRSIIKNLDIGEIAPDKTFTIGFDETIYLLPSVTLKTPSFHCIGTFINLGKHTWGEKRRSGGRTPGVLGNKIKNAPRSSNTYSSVGTTTTTNSMGSYQDEYPMITITGIEYGKPSFGNYGIDLNATWDGGNYKNYGSIQVIPFTIDSFETGEEVYSNNNLYMNSAVFINEVGSTLDISGINVFMTGNSRITNSGEDTPDFTDPTYNTNVPAILNAFDCSLNIGNGCVFQNLATNQGIGSGTIPFLTNSIPTTSVTFQNSTITNEGTMNNNQPIQFTGSTLINSNTGVINDYCGLYFNNTTQAGSNTITNSASWNSYLNQYSYNFILPNLGSNYYNLNTNTLTITDNYNYNYIYSTLNFNMDMTINENSSFNNYGSIILPQTFIITNNGTINLLTNSTSNFESGSIINNPGSIINYYSNLTNNSSFQGNPIENTYIIQINSSLLLQYGSLSGNTFTFSSDFTVPSSYKLNISSVYTWIVNTGITINVEGTVINSGTLINYGSVILTSGIFTNTGTISPLGTGITLYLTSSYIMPYVNVTVNGSNFSFITSFTLQQQYNLIIQDTQNVFLKNSFENNGIITNNGAITTYYDNYKGSGIVSGNSIENIDGTNIIFLTSSYLESYLIFTGNNYTLNNPFTLPSNYQLIISNGYSLAISNNLNVLTSNGIISNYGTITITNSGTVNDYGNTMNISGTITLDGGIWNIYINATYFTENNYGIYSRSSQTLTITSNAIIPSWGNLIIPSEYNMVINNIPGSITNNGTITNEGTITNSGTVNDYGNTINTNGTIINTNSGVWSIYVISTYLTINEIGTYFSSDFTFSIQKTNTTLSTWINSFIISPGYRLNISNNTIIFTNYGTITNEGSITNYGTVYDYGNTINTNGTISQNGGIWYIYIDSLYFNENNYGTYTNSSQTLTITSSDATIPSWATLTIPSGYYIVINSVSNLTNLKIITNYSIITNDGTLTNDGTINNDGTITNDVSGNIINNNTITNNGTITNDVSGNITNNDTITNNGTITNNNTINNNSNGTITNDGTINNNTSGAINNNSDGTISNDISGNITNGGTISNDGDLTNDGIITNNGTINNNSDGTISNDNFGNITNDISGNITNDSTIINNNIITNNNTINNNSNGTITNDVSGNIINNVTITNDGTITNFGTYSGNGIVSGNPINNSDGSFTIFLTSTYLNSYGTYSNNTYTLKNNFTILSNYTLFVSDGYSFIINFGDNLYELINNGTITNEGVFTLKEGAIGNGGLITNNTTINNYDLIINGGIIQNEGTFYMTGSSAFLDTPPGSGGKFLGNPPINN